MKMKKILAAIAACAMSAAMLGMTVFAEGETANETPVDETEESAEEITDPADDVEEPEEPEDVEEPEEPADEAPAEVAPNPTTGNAPIALAVIPVALAAAAVVVKKAK